MQHFDNFMQKIYSIILQEIFFKMSTPSSFFLYTKLPPFLNFHASLQNWTPHLTTAWTTTQTNLPTYSKTTSIANFGNFGLILMKIGGEV